MSVLSLSDVSELSCKPVFERIVCVIDETPESLEAAREAACLRAPNGSLMLVAVADLAQAAQAGYLARTAAEQIWRGAEEALQRAVVEVRPDAYRLAQGRTHAALLAELERERATLVALGAHGRRRSLGLVFGAIETTVLREAPCSVLLARPQRSDGGPPRRLVLGVDGSPQAELATAAARDLQGRFGGELRVLTSLGGKAVDIERVRTLHPGVETDPRPPVELLVEASGEADLLVVGSRGLHGFRALGSVSERVAHQALCSVLVVRARREEPPVEVSARLS